MADYLTKRGGRWYFQRRVPDDYADLDDRGLIQQTTKIKVANDPKGEVARHKAAEFNRALERYWHELATGRASDARKSYNDAIRTARRFGFDYRTLNDLATTAPLSDLLRRIETLEKRGALDNATGDNSAVRAALLGTVPIVAGAPAAVRLSELFDKYAHHEAATLRGKSRDQLRIWSNTRKRCVNRFISTIGDKDIGEITPTDARDHRQLLRDLVADEELQGASANDEMNILNKMIRIVLHNDGQNDDATIRPDIFNKLHKFAEDQTQRPAFAADYIQRVMLGPKGLPLLDDDEARRIAYVCIETGARPSEIFSLDERTIHLKASIPYIEVKNLNRQTKTKGSMRSIPLVGVALAAMKKQPNGFPRFRDRSGLLSATIGNFFDKHNLRPTEDHTFYSFRHSFKDRLRAKEVPDSMIDDLMGHSKGSKPVYGDGLSLKHLHKHLQGIAFRKLPSIV